LAQQLQAEEDDYARQLYLQHEREREAYLRHQDQRRRVDAQRVEEGDSKAKKKPCIIM
jgi:hypothetical protein